MLEPNYRDEFSFSYTDRITYKKYEYNNFLKQLKKGLVASEITQGEISRRLNVKRNTVSMWMSGKNMIPMDKALKIMNMMEYPPDFYFSDSDLLDNKYYADRWDEKMEKVRESMAFIKYSYYIYCKHRKRNDVNADKIQKHLNDIWDILCYNACNVRGIEKGYDYQNGGNNLEDEW